MGHEYALWVLDPITGEMDKCIQQDIDDYDEARDNAEDAAADRDRVILIMRDREGIEIVSPEGDVQSV